MKINEAWACYTARYRAGEWRDRIFRDMVLGDAQRLRLNPTILDIGCGGGLDGSIPLQHSIAEAAGRFIGIEPDQAVAPGEYFTEVHRCNFEEAPLAAGSVDVAYAVMVLEHLPAPQIFWDRLFEALSEGGVFWGLTVDGRHVFSRLSLWADRLRVKNIYLDRVLGQASESGRYKNYPTYYRTNTPDQISSLTRAFQSTEYINFSRVGQWRAYLPKPFQRVADVIDERSVRKGLPGTLLAVRVVK